MKRHEDSESLSCEEKRDLKRSKPSFVYAGTISRFGESGNTVTLAASEMRDEVAKSLTSQALDVLREIPSIERELKFAFTCNATNDDNNPFFLFERVAEIAVDFDLPVKLAIDKIAVPYRTEGPKSLMMVVREKSASPARVRCAVEASDRALALKSAIACQAKLILDTSEFGPSLEKLKGALQALVGQGAGFSPESDDESENDEIPSALTALAVRLSGDEREVVPDEELLELLNKAMNLPGGGYNRVFLRKVDL